MKTPLLATAAASLLLASCAGMSTGLKDNTKPYACADYNKARAKIAAKPTDTTLNDLYKDAEIFRFLKVNLVGVKTAMPKHPGTREEAMATIDDAIDLQALQCRLAPGATVKYAAEQVTPDSVRLGYSVEFPSAAPEAVKDAMADRRMNRPVANESGMAAAKAFAQNCLSKNAPAAVCKLGGL